MKKVLKWLAILLGVVFVALVGFISYIKIALPNVGDAPDLKVEITPERVARGKYLAHSVNVCMDCHSARDWEHFSGPMIPSTLGQGGEIFDQKLGFPGKFVARNITPFALAAWTDGEIYRAITAGVSKDGGPLFPVMPHHRYGKMANEDIYSLIAYLRSIPAIESHPDESSPDFPMSVILHTIPAKGIPAEKVPALSDTLAYGAYLFNAAACGECHTPQDKGAPIAGLELAGGFEFPMPNGIVVRSMNITPDKTTGIGNWSRAQFIQRFKMYADTSYKAPKIEQGGFATIMPWMMYSSMTEQDLSAIFTYMKTLKPIKHEVVRWNKL